MENQGIFEDFVKFSTAEKLITQKTGVQRDNPIKSIESKNWHEIS